MGARAVTVGVLLVAVVGYGVADSLDVAPGVLTVAPVPTRPSPSPRPTPSEPAHLAPAGVLGELSDQAQAPTPAAVRAALAPLLAAPTLGPRVSAYVADARSGEVLAAVAAERPMVPASVTKLLTAAAVLSTVGGRTRLPTRVVQGSAPDEVVLVGGGDMLLSPGAAGRDVAGRAGLDDLATQVAARLRDEGQPEVVVRFDDALFAGPSVAPSWAAADVSIGYAGRVASLGLATDRARPGHPSSTDPARTAAVAFAAALRRAGVGVSGTPARVVAPDQAPVLGQVESAPVGEVLGVALRESDNALAEVMGRLVAGSLSRPTTATDAALAVLDAVQQLGVDVGSTTIRDTSGLGPGSVVPARVLGELLVLATSPDQPRLRPMLEGLPVAAFTGTLADRYDTASTRPAAGVVRAKTGTLTGVSAVAGTTVDADGRLLVFVVMADRVPTAGTLAAREVLDRVGARLAGCGCR